MGKEVTKEEILQTMSGFADHVDKRFDGMQGQIDGMQGQIDGMQGQIDGIKKHMATKEDLKDLEDKIENKIDEKMDKILTAVDGIAKKHSNFDSDMVANQGAHDRFEARITALENKVA